MKLHPAAKKALILLTAQVRLDSKARAPARHCVALLLTLGRLRVPRSRGRLLPYQTRFRMTFRA